MRVVDVIKYQSKIKSGEYMVTVLVLNLVKFSVTIHLLEDDMEKINSLKRELTNFPYLLSMSSATVKITEENFDTLTEYRYNPNR